jgi:magnesium transporter
MQVLTEVDRDRIAGLRERDEFFWLDLNDPPPARLEESASVLGLHPMALEDTEEFAQRPKVDVYDDNVLVVFYTVRPAEGAETVASPIEVHVYVSGHFVLTVHRDPCAALARLHGELAGEPTRNEDYLVYRILDALTDAFYPIVEAFEERVDALEGQVLARPRREQLGVVYRLRQEVRELHRLVSAQRDQFQTAADAIRSLGGLTRGAREYLRDVGDHLTQIAGELHRQNEDLLALTTMYFNANADRLNATVTRLTIIGTLFISWTLVTGFFGQNFGWLVDHIAGLNHFLIYGVGGLLVPTVALLAVFWVKRADWF